MNSPMRARRTLHHVGACAILVASFTNHGSGAIARASAIPQVRRSTKYYELGAPTIAELLTEFRTAAGKGGVPAQFGLTKWDVTLTTSPYFGTRTLCSTQLVTLRVALTTTLPKAVQIARFSAEDAAEWQRFLTVLERHEAQHDSIVVAQATTFLRQIERDTNREGGQITMEQCVADILGRIERASTIFDAITQHGATDGAVLRFFRAGPPGPSRR